MLRQYEAKASCRNIMRFGQSFSDNIKMFISCGPEDIDRLQKREKNSLLVPFCCLLFSRRWSSSRWCFLGFWISQCPNTKLQVPNWKCTSCLKWKYKTRLETCGRPDLSHTIGIPEKGLTIKVEDQVHQVTLGALMQAL